MRHFLPSWNPLELLAPRKCLVCGEDAPHPICAVCMNQMELVGKGGCRRCGNPSVHGEATDCWWCQRLGILPAHLVACFIYRGEGKTVYQLIKFQYYWRLIRSIAPLFVSAYLSSDAFLDFECICPIPETTIQKFRRPFHPASLIAEILSRSTGMPKRNLLTVAPWTKRQVGLDLARRRQNLKGKFKVRKVPLPNSVLLVDDVITTGTTMESASLTLRRSGVIHVGWFSLFRTI